MSNLIILLFANLEKLLQTNYLNVNDNNRDLQEELLLYFYHNLGKFHKQLMILALWCGLTRPVWIDSCCLQSMIEML